MLLSRVPSESTGDTHFGQVLLAVPSQDPATAREPPQALTVLSGGLSLGLSSSASQRCVAQPLLTHGNFFYL